MLGEEKTQDLKKVDNSAYRDKFRFLLYVNDNVIVERFFKINGFNSDVLHSRELRDAIYEIVFHNQFAGVTEDEKCSIMDDLLYKSRIYQWYNNDMPLKLTGFMKDGQGFLYRNATYLDYPKDETTENVEEEVLKPYDVTFKFSLQMANEVQYVEERPMYSNYKPIYECIFDGTQFPRYIRTNVNITNSNYQDRSKAPFWREIDKKLIEGRSDLIYYTIKKICDITNLYEENKGKGYTKSETYTSSDKKVKSRTYSYNPINKKYYDGWKAYTKAKTDKYFKELYPNMIDENNKK